MTEKALGNGSTAEALKKDVSKMNKKELQVKCDELEISYEEGASNNALKKLIFEKQGDQEVKKDDEPKKEEIQKKETEVAKVETPATRKINTLTRGNKIAATADTDVKIGQLERNVKHNGVFYEKGQSGEGIPKEIQKYVKKPTEE